MKVRLILPRWAFHAAGVMVASMIGRFFIWKRWSLALAMVANHFVLDAELGHSAGAEVACY